jgi:3-oxoacyl-[acyl-carrier protein] reductase
MASSAATSPSPNNSAITKSALVLGASGTLGGRVARELISRGYAVGLHYHTRAEACHELAALALSKGVSAQCYAADFTRAEAAVELATAFLKDFSRIDALICCAGIVRDTPLLTLKDADLRAVVNVNLRAVFLVLKAFSRQFMKQKSGAVVALSSHAGVAGRAGGSAYAMAHSGLQALVRSAAREWGAFNVRVNAVLPPFVPESGMGRAASPEFAAVVKSRRVLKAEMDGATAAATFIVEVLHNPAISGQILCADSRLHV